MLVGKRPRSTFLMRRTESKKDFSPENGSPPSDQDIPPSVDGNQPQQRRRVEEDFQLDRRRNGADSLASASKSADLVETMRSRRGAGDFPAASMKISPFLRVCALCDSHLQPARDIFMYRGEAFCSLECRQQLINDDTRKEKLKLFFFVMKKKGLLLSAQASKASDKGEETMAAA